MAIRAILFDKDGTLTELGDLWVKPTVDFIEQCLKNNANQLTTEQKEMFYQSIGIVDEQIVPNSIVASATVEELAEKVSEVTELDVKKLTQQMNVYFTEYLAQHPWVIKPLTNVIELFNELKSRQLLIGVVTSDSRLPTLKVLEILEIESMVDFIATADDFPWKPDLTSLYAFCEEFDIAPDEVMYIGDSLVDMEYASYAGQAIAVLSGNTPKDLLIERADHLIDSIDDLLGILED